GQADSFHPRWPGNPGGGQFLAHGPAQAVASVRRGKPGAAECPAGPAVGLLPGNGGAGRQQPAHRHRTGGFAGVRCPKPGLGSGHGVVHPGWARQHAARTAHGRVGHRFPLRPTPRYARFPARPHRRVCGHGKAGHCHPVRQHHGRAGPVQPGAVRRVARTERPGRGPQAHCHAPRPGTRRALSRGRPRRGYAGGLFKAHWGVDL
ncbi:MAG: Molybdenum cofactor cytidylyltransferase, partial [uncultured Cytophagales bacterium]